MNPIIGVIQVGLGPVGQMLTPFLFERKNLKVIGAVDIDPQFEGKDLGDVARLGRPTGIAVRRNLESFQKGSADAIVLTTTSKLESIVPTLETAARLGLNVVSTCEELVYPWVTQPDLAERIDRMARENDVSFLGTGVNPGFLMDVLAVMATAICRDVEKVRIERIQDASIRRIPFQRKIGTGLTKTEFEQKVADGKLGHVGLTESMHMIAARLGWKLTRTEDRIEPVLARKAMETGLGKVPEGKAVGLTQDGRGWMGSEEVLRLLFRAAIGEPDSHDSIEIVGTPGFKMTIPGGVHGDVATCAIVTNSIASAVEAAPGLRTMADIPPVSFRS